MTRHHTSFRLSEPAMRKLAELAEVYGNRTSVLEIAIDRLYEDQFNAYQPRSPEHICQPKPKP